MNSILVTIVDDQWDDEHILVFDSEKEFATFVLCMDYDKYQVVDIEFLPALVERDVKEYIKKDKYMEFGI